MTTEVITADVIEKHAQKKLCEIDELKWVLLLIVGV